LGYEEAAAGGERRLVPQRVHLALFIIDVLDRLGLDSLRSDSLGLCGADSRHDCGSQQETSHHDPVLCFPNRGGDQDRVSAVTMIAVPTTPMSRAIRGELPRKARARQARTSAMCRIANNTSLLKRWNVFRCARRSWRAARSS